MQIYSLVNIKAYFFAKVQNNPQAQRWENAPAPGARAAGRVYIIFAPGRAQMRRLKK